MMTNRNRPTVEDVLNEFMAEYDRPSAEALEHWIKLYPHFRKDIVEFAAAWAEQLTLPPAADLGAEVEASLLRTAMSHVQNVAYLQTESTLALSDQPIKSLTAEAQKHGVRTGAFAKLCGLDLALMSKLSDRRFSLSEIPSFLIEQIAKVLRRSTGDVSAYLQGEPRMSLGNAYLSKTKPTADSTESFREAVQASSLSDAEKARLLANNNQKGM